MADAKTDNRHFYQPEAVLLDIDPETYAPGIREAAVEAVTKALGELYQQIDEAMQPVIRDAVLAYFSDATMQIEQASRGFQVICYPNNPFDEGREGVRRLGLEQLLIEAADVPGGEEGFLRQCIDRIEALLPRLRELASQHPSEDR